MEEKVSVHKKEKAVEVQEDDLPKTGEASNFALYSIIGLSTLAGMSLVRCREAHSE